MVQNAISLFKICFDKTLTCINDDDGYYPGQNVSGYVQLVLDKPLEVCNVGLHVEGKAQAEFMMHEGSIKDTRNEEVFIDKCITFFGKMKGEDDDPNLIMPSGSYEFSFSFDIPSNCPPSFVSQRGKIEYLCNAYVNQPNNLTEKCWQYFDVLPMVNLNKLPCASAPQELSKAKTLGCLCCTRGTIECIASIPRSAFIPGEYIEINGEIENKSTTPINKVVISLMEICSFKADGEWHCKTKQVSVKTKGCVNAGESEILTKEYLLIPNVHPTMSCSIINLSYELHITVVPKGCHVNLKLVFPITVGTIPLRPNRNLAIRA